jgi:hypothetical protein
VSAADSQAAHVAEVVAAGGVVDSILPLDEMLRRFRAGTSEHPDTLRGASASLDALVARWAVAVSQRDSAALNAMVIDRAEFAWMYYPDSPMTKPPYEMPPGLLWSQVLANSDEGAKGLLARFGGASIRVHGVSCNPGKAQGHNIMHEGCEVRATVGGKPIAKARLFGSVIERGGRFKFLGYANSL